MRTTTRKRLTSIDQCWFRGDLGADEGAVFVEPDVNDCSARQVRIKIEDNEVIVATSVEELDEVIGMLRKARKHMVQS